MSDPIFTSLTVSGPAAITGNLSVNRDSSGVGGNINAAGSLTADSMRVQGTTLVAGAALEVVGGGLDVAGSTSLNGPVAVSGALTLNGALNASAGATISGALSVSGPANLGNSLSVGGSSTIGSTLTVGGAIRAGNSDIYFTNTSHNHTALGNAAGHAAIENAADYDALMILGRSGTDKGRKVRLWDYLEVNGAIAANNSDIYFTNTTHNHTGFGNTTGHAAIENAANYDALMILGRSGTNRGRKVRLWDYLEVNGRLEAHSFNASGHVLMYTKWIVGWTWGGENSYFHTLNHASRSQFDVHVWSSYNELFYGTAGGHMNLSISSTTDTSTTFRLFVREAHARFDLYALCIRR